MRASGSLRALHELSAPRFLCSILPSGPDGSCAFDLRSDNPLTNKLSAGDCSRLRF
jgi:hypothetical protein